MAIKCPECECEVRLAIFAPDMLVMLEQIVASDRVGWNRLDAGFKKQIIELIKKAKGDE